MGKAGFTQADGLRLLGQLLRLTAGPARAEEIGGEVLALVAGTLGAGGAILLERAGESDRVVATYGRSEALAAEAAGGAVGIGDGPGSDGGAAGRRAGVRGAAGAQAAPAGRRLVVPLALNDRRLGAIVLERDTSWTEAGRQFAMDAGRAISAALGSARTLDELRQQGERLERRNLELEILRDLTRRLRDGSDDQEMLQAALDLILEKLALKSGWIFWDADNRGRLGLAASRGVAESFVCQARETGIGDCLCRDVYATGQRMQPRNTLECPRLPHLASDSDARSHACIPLKFERGILGVLNIGSRPGKLFSPEELAFLETVGRHVCLAVDRAQSARAEARRNDEARALVSLARAMGGSLHLETVLSAAGTYARELLDVERCALFLGDSIETLRFAFLAGKPLPGLEVGRPADFKGLGSRAVPEAIRRRRPLVIRDAADDPHSDAVLARRWEVGSVIVVPLVGHDTLEGLMFASRARSGDWPQDEVDLAGALAGQAALAIENARLYEQTQDTLLKLQQAQYSMMRSERLAAAGTLASSLAHEVRNPLNAINLQLVLLTRRLARLEAPQRDELTALVDTSRHEIARLDQLVEEFLQMSSVDRVRMESGSPEEVAREVLEFLTPVARQHGVAVRDSLSGCIPAIPIDREKIRQVLVNLVRNAIEAMTEGGTLTLSSDLSEGTPVLRVADTGVGIDPGFDVFDFFSTTKLGGTGLGLPIARRIVEAHGGTLTFESRKGVGTVFSLTFKPVGRGRPDAREERTP